MLALAGYPLGLQFAFLDGVQGVAGQLASLHQADYHNLNALENFAQGLQLVTYEFENVPVTAAQHLQSLVPVYPPVAALQVSQERVAEKTYLQGLGIPVPPFYPVLSLADLQNGLEQVGFPALLKTRTLGYDGKGQVFIESPTEVERVWQQMGGVPLILEGFIEFDRELSLIAVRSRSGEMVFYPLCENYHNHGILRTTLAPAPGLDHALQAQAEEYARRVLLGLDYVGVLAIEFFELEGRLLANEMAPRVHNSGHWTIEGAECSQFENHLRAILGWPLGSTAPRGYSAMLNLIGTLPQTAQVLSIPGAHLHLYGKEPRPGRKLGHVTVGAEDLDDLYARIEELSSML